MKADSSTHVVRSRHGIHTLVAALLVLTAVSFGPPALAAADHLLVLLPGQSFQPGVGIVGTPSPVTLRASVRLRIVAVDQFDNVAEDYSGRLVHVSVLPFTGPGVGPPVARRYGTVISAIGAATSTPGGELRIALGGGPFQVITVAPAATPAQICQAIVNGVRALPVEAFENGPFDVGCTFSGSALGARFTLFLDDGTPVRAVMNTRLATSGGSSIIIDPSYGLAPALHLGAPTPSSNPNDGDEYVERRPAEPNGADQRFSRGIAMFEMAVTSFADVGSGKTIGLDQGPGPALPIQSTPFTIQPSSLGIVHGTAIGDGNGRINRVRLVFNEPIDPASLSTLSASDFSLLAPGFPPMSGTSFQASTITDHGYSADQIEVTFGTGLGRTDITNVELRYTPPASNMIGSESGVALGATVVSPGGSPPLVDGAPPVIVNAFAQDVDGNNGLDRMTFFFSEPVGFSAAQGVSVSGFSPITDTAMTVPVPFDLTLESVGLVTDVGTFTVTDPNDPAATSITGADAIADAITAAVRHDPLNRPALVNFTCTFTNGRYVLRAGIPLRTTAELHVLPSSVPGQGPPAALRLGPQNGGLERPGSGNALVRMPPDVVLTRGSDGANLLLGKTEADMTIAGDSISFELTNVPNSGTATPSYLWKDNGDLGFITDRAPVPNRMVGFNNVGLPPDFHPVTMLREASSSPSSTDGSLVRTATVGDVTLDGSPSVLPLNPESSEHPSTFTWTQVEGPFVSIPPHNNGVATVVPTVAGTYVYRVTLEVTHFFRFTEPPYNPYTNADGTLSRSLVLTVQPGPPSHVVVLLPGQELATGAVSTDEVVAGIGKVATEGSAYVVRVVTTDDFFNEVPAPPGAQVRLHTTDPDDVEPPFRPFAGSTATFVLTPSHAATLASMVIDDEVVGVFEHGDINRPYVVGSLWNAHTLPPLPGQHGIIRLSWTADPRAVKWSVYRAGLPLADVDRDGLPDLGYGTCTPDPDPTDTYFEDATIPAPGSGLMYAGTESLVASGVVQEAGLGRTKAGMERPNYSPCP